jgi:prevent-host-death family protein
LIKSNDLIKLHELTQHIGGSSMQTYTANEAKTRFGEFLDRVQREPVRVMRHDRVVGVMVSAQDYEAMRAFYADRLLHTMDETADAAARAGLTPEALAALLADES